MSHAGDYASPQRSFGASPNASAAATASVTSSGGRGVVGMGGGAYGAGAAGAAGSGGGASDAMILAAEKVSESSIAGTEEELRTFSDVMASAERIRRENKLFENFIQRNGFENDPKILAALARMQKKKQSFVELSLLHKYSTIAMQELEYKAKHLRELESKAADDENTIKALIAATQVRINELRKEVYEFKRDIVEGSENARTGKIMAERVLRYMDDKIRAKDALIKNIDLKNKQLKELRAKMEKNVRRKEEAGDSLHFIDFQQMKIKNDQFNHKIEERGRELLALKQKTTNTIKVLTGAKLQLKQLTDAQRALKRDIRDREDAIRRLSHELDAVRGEVGVEHGRNTTFKIQQSNPDMPQVLDYVNQKSLMYELEAELRNWTRKLEIVEIAAKRARALLKALQLTENGQPSPQPPAGQPNGWFRDPNQPIRGGGIAKAMAAAGGSGAGGGAATATAAAAGPTFGQSTLRASLAPAPPQTPPSQRLPKVTK